MKTIKSYVNFLNEEVSEPQIPNAEVWQQIYKELSPKAHKKTNKFLAWGESAKKDGVPGKLGFNLSSDSNRIIVRCDQKQIKDIQKKATDDFSNLSKIKSDGSTYIIFEYDKKDASTPVLFANYIIDELKPEDPNKIDSKKPIGERKPDISVKSLDKPLPNLWVKMSKNLSKIGQAKLTPQSIVWGEHKKRTADRDENELGITMSKEVSKIFITCGPKTYSSIKELIKQHPELKIIKDESPTKGIYASGGKLTLQYQGNDGDTPVMFITQLNDEIGI